MHCVTVSSSSKQGGSGREDSRAPSVFYSFEDTLFRMSDINMPHSCSKKLLIVTGTDIIRQTTLITDIWPAWRQLILPNLLAVSCCSSCLLHDVQSRSPLQHMLEYIWIYQIKITWVVKLCKEQLFRYTLRPIDRRRTDLAELRNCPTELYNQDHHNRGPQHQN